MQAYYQAKSEKYKSLLETSREDFEKKLEKKKESLLFWRANYQLWSYRGCMTRDVIPEECNEMKCEQIVFKTYAKHACKVEMMIDMFK